MQHNTPCTSQKHGYFHLDVEMDWESVGREHTTRVEGHQLPRTTKETKESRLFHATVKNVISTEHKNYFF